MKPDPLLLAKKSMNLNMLNIMIYVNVKNKILSSTSSIFFFTLLKIQDSIEAVRFFKI